MSKKEKRGGAVAVWGVEWGEDGKVMCLSLRELT